MQRIFEIWLGTDLYDQDKPAYNYIHRLNPSDNFIQEHLARVEAKVVEREVLYFLATLTTFDTMTGQTETRTWHKAGEVKAKTILNPKARQFTRAKKKVDWAGLMEIHPEVAVDVGAA